MKHIRYIFFILVMTLLIIGSNIGGLLAQSDYGFQILKISPEDETAVIKTGDNNLSVVKAGDEILNRRGRILEIAKDRIVVDFQNPVETVIFNFKNEKQEYHKIKKTAEVKTIFYPVMSDRVNTNN